MQDLQELVDHYVAQLSGPNAFNACHSLIAAGPPALALVRYAVNMSTDTHVKVSLVRIVSEYRTEYAVPFLRHVLQDRKPEMWKAALDGLVILGDQAALNALCEARIIASREQRPWLEEAIQQITDGL